AGETSKVQEEFPDFTFYHDPEIDQLRNMDEFAAQIAACDRVIGIGNTTAHMAGALGVPGEILLPIAGLTWYWFTQITECPWYPRLQLLRKEKEGDWSGALAKLQRIK